MLTLREAIQMPVFASSQVVAGHSGLDNDVRWVHIVDIPDARYEWKRQGVLLLTAGFGLRDDPERQATLMPKLVEQGFAGMVLSTGYYFEHTPQVILKAADDLGFPVIETPRDVLFIDITEVILEQIVNRQYALLQQSTRIHEQLTNLVLRGGDLNDLASTLSAILKRSVTVEDTGFRVLAAAQHGLVDEARRRSVSRGRTSPEVVQRLLDEGIYTQLREQMTPIHVPAIPELGMIMERFVAPIIVDREVYGYIWIIAGDHPLTELDELALGHGATVAALIIFREQSMREAEKALRGDFFDLLLSGAADSAELAEQAHRLNFRLDRPRQVLVIHSAPGSGGITRVLADSVQEWLLGRGDHALIIHREEALILVVESDDANAGKQLGAALAEDLSHPAQRLLVGVGEVYRPTDESTAIQHSYEGAREAVRIGIAMGRDEGTVAFDELGLLHWLYNLPPSIRADNPFLAHISTLAAYDAERNAELIKTLETYLDHGGSLVETAAVLHIHRNTLLHRIKRIAELCSLDLRDPLQRLNLHVAVKSYRLNSRD